jgi:hypothetical protein
VKYINADGTFGTVPDWRQTARHGIKGQLVDWVQQYQAVDRGGIEVLMGLADTRPLLRYRDRQEFLYCDHAYFDRGWDKFHFRLTRNDAHLTHLIDRPDDRLKRWNVQIEPWRKGGRSIVVIVPQWHQSRFYFLHNWHRTVIDRLRQVTDRPIHLKETKGRLRECLLEEQDAHALVCYASVAGMEAALMGIPVFSTERCCSWPVNAGTLEDIERPEYPERHQWACGLAYASWSAEELDSIDFRDYQYSVKERTFVS